MNVHRSKLQVSGSLRLKPQVEETDLMRLLIRRFRVRFPGDPRLYRNARRHALVGAIGLRGTVLIRSRLIRTLIIEFGHIRRLS